MGKHRYTKFDRARDEMMSHVVRCEVLDAHMVHRREWLEETMDYMADRYPQLSEMELAKLEMVGRQFIKPPIPHGKGNTAITRDRRLKERLAGEAEAAESPELADAVRPSEEMAEGELQAA